MNNPYIMGCELKIAPGKMTQIYCRDTEAFKQMKPSLDLDQALCVGHDLTSACQVQTFVAAYTKLWAIDRKVFQQRFEYFCSVFSIDPKQSIKQLSQVDMWLVEWISVMSVQPKFVAMYQTVYLTESTINSMKQIINALRKYQIKWLVVGDQHWFDADYKYKWEVVCYERAW